MTFRTLAISLTLFVSACASTVGKPIDASTLSGIKKGVTTESELQGIVGRKPDQVVMKDDGRKIYMWMYGHTNSNPLTSTVKTETESLVVLVGTAGIVENASYSSGGTPIQTGF